MLGKWSRRLGGRPIAVTLCLRGQSAGRRSTRRRRNSSTSSRTAWWITKPARKQVRRCKVEDKGAAQAAQRKTGTRAWTVSPSAILRGMHCQLLFTDPLSPSYL